MEPGGARRDRTADLYNAIVALSQLSYGPLKRLDLGGWQPFYMKRYAPSRLRIVAAAKGLSSA